MKFAISEDGIRDSETRCGVEFFGTGRELQEAATQILNEANNLIRCPVCGALFHDDDIAYGAGESVDGIYETVAVAWSCSRCGGGGDFD